MRFAKALRYPALLALGAAAVFGAVMVFRTPSLERDWKVEYAVLPQVAIEGDAVSLRNVRNFAYGPDGAIDEARYYDADYDLAALTGVWYGLSHFTDYGLAHSFLSFGFADGRFLAVSIEGRQERGEDYHPVWGLFRNFELVYVLADERDVIGLRTHVRKQRVLLYELVLSGEDARALLVSLLQTADEAARRPSFYNTLTDNCTTNIVKYAEDISPWQHLLDYRVLLPGYSDRLAYELGLIATDRPLEALQERAYLDPARAAPDDPDFSIKIRGLSPP
ncbi:MAG: DUF4105 domain-containing protein [Rhodospirillales bacterium]|nr:DUF4105 domain-containing protein [Rhodospirillales bacterium]